MALWHYGAMATVGTVLAVAAFAKNGEEFVSFTPCGYRPVDLGGEAPFGELFTVAPNFKRFDVRPGAVAALAMVDTGQNDIVCTVLRVGNEHQAVLGSIDEVKAKLTQ